MSRKVQPSYTPEEVKSAFKVCTLLRLLILQLRTERRSIQVFESATGEQHQPGYVSISALEKALTTYGTEKLSSEEAQELLSQVRHGCGYRRLFSCEPYRLMLTLAVW